MDGYYQLKEKLKAECIRLKQESADNLGMAMREAQQAANEYGAPKDRYDSFRTQLLRKRDMMAQQFQKVSDEIRFLQQLKTDSICSEVQPGALVILPGQILYVSVGLGKLDIEGKTYYAISPSVPLVQAMKGAKTGQEFLFRGNKMRVEAIY